MTTAEFWWFIGGPLTVLAYAGILYFLHIWLEKRGW